MAQAQTSHPSAPPAATRCRTHESQAENRQVESTSTTKEGGKEGKSGGRYFRQLGSVENNNTHKRTPLIGPYVAKEKNLRRSQKAKQCAEHTKNYWSTNTALTQQLPAQPYGLLYSMRQKRSWSSVTTTLQYLGEVSADERPRGILAGEALVRAPLAIVLRPL